MIRGNEEAAKSVGRRLGGGRMKFKEFKSWCEQRACDGCWGLAEAMASIAIIEIISSAPFWKREKLWREEYEESVVRQIVNPIERKIKEVLGE